MRLMNKTAAAALLLAAAGSALAHPGHGADFWHLHGDQVLAVGGVALALLAVGVAWVRSR